MATLEEPSATRRLISPAVARLAAERGITPPELQTLPGSGVGGRLLAVDLPAAPAASAGAPVAQARTVRSADPGVHRVLSAGATATREPIVVSLDEHQQEKARAAIEDIQASAQLTSAVEVDVTGLVRRMQQAQQGDVTDGDVRELLLPSLVATLAATLADHPALNARIDVAQGTVTYHDHVDLGVVVSGPHGDTAAIVPDAAGRARTDIAGELATLRLLASAGVQISRPTSDATFTLYDRTGTPILFETPPLPLGTSASLALGWVERRPVAAARPEVGFRVAWAGYLCLTYDHRLVDGADAARFLSDLAVAFAGDGSEASADV